MLISEFARRSRLPVSTLRYYDRIGVLVPAVTDAASGYRHYTSAQLLQAALVERLRAAGVVPDSIRRIVTGGPGASAALGEEIGRVRAELTRGHRAMDLLSTLLAASTVDTGVPQPSGSPVPVVLTAGWVVRRRFRLAASHLPLHELGRPLLRELSALRSALRRTSVAPTGQYGVCLPVDPADIVDGFVFAPVTAPSHPGLDVVPMPGGTAVRVAHLGPVESVAVGYHAAFAAVEALGGTPVGHLIEEYPTLHDPRDGGAAVVITLPYRTAAPAS